MDASALHMGNHDLQIQEIYNYSTGCTWETMIHSHMENHELHQQFGLSFKTLGLKIISSLLHPVFLLSGGETGYRAAVKYEWGHTGQI